MRQLSVVAVAACGLAMGQILLALPAHADSLGQPCSDPSKISYNSDDSTHEMIVCAGTVWGTMPTPEVPGANHITGTPCNFPGGTTAVGGDAQGAYLQMCYFGKWAHVRP